MRLRGTVKGFTLIELLVVIAIIGILAAILAIAMTTARRVSLQTVCVNNLNNLGKALQMYLDQESDGYLPKVQGANSNGDVKDWPDVLRRYLGGSLGDWNDDIRVKDEADWGGKVPGKYKIFDCPANKRPESEAPGERFDYTYNTKLANSPTGGPWLSENCGNVVVLHDHVNIAITPVNSCLGIHGGQDNFLFLGGWVKQSELDDYATKSENEAPWDPAQ